MRGRRMRGMRAGAEWEAEYRSRTDIRNNGLRGSTPPAAGEFGVNGTASRVDFTSPSLGVARRRATASQFMMESLFQQSRRRRMLTGLFVAGASIAATVPIRAQTDARAGVTVSAKTVATPPLQVPPRIAYTRLVLPNGLAVVVHEDHTAPI